MAANPEIDLKQAEAKTLRFTIRDKNGELMDVADPTDVSFRVEDRAVPGSFIVNKANAVFDKTKAAAGVVTVSITAVETAQTPGKYVGELRVEETAAQIDKSVDIDVNIVKSISS